MANEEIYVGDIPAEVSYGLLRPGRYNVTIASTKKDEFGIVRRPYAKDGANAQLTALAVRFVIDQGQPSAGANLFRDVALAAKFPESGKDNRLLFDLFRALGYEFTANTRFVLPDDGEIVGKHVQIVVGLEERQGYDPRNVVSFINKAGAAATPATLEQLPEHLKNWVPGAGNRAAANVQQAPAGVPSGFAGGPQQAWGAPQQQVAPQGYPQQQAPAPQGQFGVDQGTPWLAGQGNPEWPTPPGGVPQQGFVGQPA